jgi:hypothetical protein
VQRVKDRALKIANDSRLKIASNDPWRAEIFPQACVKQKSGHTITDQVECAMMQKQTGEKPVDLILVHDSRRGVRPEVVERAFP